MPNRTIVFAIALAILGGCSPSAPPELDPVFVVMCPDVDPEELHHPCCTGFALGTQVVTASHCVPGDTAELVSNQQWLNTSNASQTGTVLARDDVRDIAWLSAALDGPGLEQGGSVAQGDQVRVLTRSGAKPGSVREPAGAFWLTSADTKYGDSGAAVVDLSGAAVGVLSRCLTADGKQCDPGTGIFAELPR
jgi:hypothetical protein